MTGIEITSLDRASYYQACKVDQLREEVAAARQRVAAGHGAEPVLFFNCSVSEWLEVLEADLLAAECDLETLNVERGAVQ